jgi:hypothetical protein
LFSQLVACFLSLPLELREVSLDCCDVDVAILCGGDVLTSSAVLSTLSQLNIKINLNTSSSLPLIEKTFSTYNDWLHEARGASSTSPRSLWLLFSEWPPGAEERRSTALRLASIANHFLSIVKQVHFFYYQF